MVVEVALPQAPVGAAFVAPSRSPVVVLQAIEGVRLKAVEQELCEYIIAGKQRKEKNRMTVNLVDSNMVLKGFLEIKNKQKHLYCYKHSFAFFIVKSP